MNDTSPRTALLTGIWLLAFSLPLGLTLEALHAMKVQVYLGSALRRELWTLAHAHGNLLGILCLVVSALGPRLAADPAQRRRNERLLAVGAVLMPLGFLLGGVLNSEGDPSPGILLVPLGGVAVFVALVLAARGAKGAHA
ncbi:MAG TPA: hypothetical protein VFZ65_19155 [Planctomycetota bacterium]|nr:hypothetical protein [Planctomycetota bacterium]